MSRYECALHNSSLRPMESYLFPNTSSFLFVMRGKPGLFHQVYPYFLFYLMEPALNRDLPAEW